MIHCWKCQKEISDLPNKIGFRAVCPHCGIDLHCCVNCKYYSPGKPNDCLVPGTEWIRDREAMNFCEDYALKKTEAAKPSDRGQNFKSLFRDDET